MKATPATFGHALGSELDALERAVEHLSAVRRTHSPLDPTDSTLVELHRLHDELASHALAARVLVSSGASDDAVSPVLQRARALLEASTGR